MRTRLILGVLVLILFAGSASAQAGGPYAPMASEIIRLVNEHRAKMGLGPMATNLVVARVATMHSKDMATKKIPFGHDGFDERMAIIAKQLKCGTASAENVAYGAKTAAAAMDMWLHSEGHRKNIEGNYNITGIGIVKGKDGNLYFTEIFIKK